MNFTLLVEAFIMDNITMHFIQSSLYHQVLEAATIYIHLPRQSHSAEVKAPDIIKPNSCPESQVLLNILFLVCWFFLFFGFLNEEFFPF